jgi:hypothetical protein
MRGYALVTLLMLVVTLIVAVLVTSAIRSLFEGLSVFS